MPQTRDPHPASVAERAYLYLRQRVECGALKPGEKIVTRTIAREIGSSLNPVREAIGRLASEGLIAHVPGAGASVRRIDRADVIELYGLRKAIESFAAAEAARLIGEAELDQLEEIVEHYHRLACTLREQGTLDAEQTSQWISCNVSFHRTLVDAARNRYLSKCIDDFRILATIFDAHRRARAVPSLTVAAHTWRTHAKLVRILRRRDGAAARALVEHQLRTGLRHSLSVLESHSQSPH